MLSRLTTEELQAALDVFRSYPYWTPREELNERLHQSQDWLIVKETAGNGPMLLAAAISNELFARELVNLLGRLRG